MKRGRAYFKLHTIAFEFLDSCLAAGYAARLEAVYSGWKVSW